MGLNRINTTSPEHMNDSMVLSSDKELSFSSFEEEKKQFNVESARLLGSQKCRGKAPLSGSSEGDGEGADADPISEIQAPPIV